MNPSNRYDISDLPEAQAEPGSRGRVLRNKVGIKSKRKMDEAERVALKTATDKLLGMYDAGHCFTAEDIQGIHKIWLGEIYEWSGEYRQVNVSKGDFHFAAALHIPQLMADFSKGLLRQHTPCRFKSKERIIQALAEVHVELVLIHPFREGNGRVARLLATLMALQAGLPPLDFTGIVGKRKKAYLVAVQAGMERIYTPMEKIFESAIRKTLKAREQQ
ncbi:MAG: cell filamentation protein Fic [Thermodesulfovibrio sp.]|nr:cell filamentation protein Fic [Thermodesulfovibrio sp.]